MDPKLLQFLETADRDARLLASTAIRLLRLAVRITQDDSLGLSAASETAVGDYGDVEYAARACGTVGEALDFLCANYHMIDEASKLRYVCVERRVHLSVTQPRELACRAASDFTLGMLYLSCVRWVGFPPPDFEVRFPYPEPADSDRYRAFFGPDTRLRFGAEHGEATFREVDLFLSLKHADPKLHQLLARYARKRYADDQRKGWLVDATRTCILEGVPQGQVSTERVAAVMGMGRRTLARRLREEGTTFRRLLSDVRSASALRYLLLHGLKVEERSEPRGHGEPSPFYRALRDWFGEPSSADRNQGESG